MLNSDYKRTLRLFNTSHSSDARDILTLIKAMFVGHTTYSKQIVWNWEDYIVSSISKVWMRARFVYRIEEKLFVKYIQIIV